MAARKELMKTDSAKLPKGSGPKVEIELYLDSNGNWFAGLTWHKDDVSGKFYTSTFTTPEEAVQEAMVKWCGWGQYRRA